MERKKFNPYDLNDVANIDKFIEEWEKEELAKQTSIEDQPTPTAGILKKDTTQPKTI